MQHRLESSFRVSADASGFRNPAAQRFSEHDISDSIPVANLAEFAVHDLLGTGTACLVRSSPLPSDSGRAWQYVDLMGGQKPYLLTLIPNTRGAGNPDRLHTPRSRTTGPTRDTPAHHAASSGSFRLASKRPTRPGGSRW